MNGAPSKARSRRYETLLWIGIGISALLFTVLCQLRHRTFLAFEWDDLAAANHIAWNTSRGNLFFQTVTGQIFKGHVQPIYLLVSVPYLLVSHIGTLHFLGSFALAVGAIPLLWIAKKALRREGLAFGCGLAYLLYAPLHYVNLADFRGVVFAVPFLFLTFHYLEESRFRPFMICLGLVLMCKENLALVTALFGVYAAYRRRRWYWVVVPLVMGPVWLAVCLKVFMPLFACNVRYPYLPYLFPWAEERGLSDVLSMGYRAVLRFGSLAVSHNRLVLLYKLLWPLCFLPLLSPEVLFLAAPSLLQCLVHSQEYLDNVRAHWLAAAFPFFAIACVFSLKKLLWLLGRTSSNGRIARHGPKAAVAALVLVSLASNFSDNILGYAPVDRNLYDTRFLHVTNIYDRRFYAMDEADADVWDLIRLVPKGASVSTTGHLLPALSHRGTVKEFLKRYFYLDDGRARDTFDVDYILVDVRNLAHGSGRYFWIGEKPMVECLKALLRGGAWELVEAKGRAVLLRRCRGHRPESQRLSDVVRLCEEQARSSWPGGAGERLKAANMALQRGPEGHEDAVRELRAAIEVAPDYGKPHNELARRMIAEGQGEEGVTHARRAVELNPRSGHYQYALASACRLAGRTPEAETHYRKAIRRFPVEARFWEGIGNFYFSQKRFRKARSHLRRALLLKCELPSARLTLARCYAALGLLAEAERECQRVLEAHSTDHWGAKARKALAEIERRRTEGRISFGPEGP